MSARYNHVFILAAGEGRRMRPFTDHTPKPMAEIGGETLIHRAIKQCRDAGIDNIFVNAYHLADKLIDHISDRANVVCEPALLNTGGGIKNILPHMPPDKPFYCISGDSWWIDDDINVFEQMDAAWHDDFDLLLVLQKVSAMTATPGHGDYYFDKGIPHRALDKVGTHMFTSHRIIHPRLFNKAPNGPFSFLDLMDKAEAEGRLGAIELQGVWHHITDMNDTNNVNRWLKHRD